MTANSVPQINQANDYLPPVSTAHALKADGIEQDNGIESSSRTIGARFDPVPDNAEDGAISIRDEGSVNKKYVLQGSEAAKAAGTIDGSTPQDTHHPVSYLPMLDCPFTVQVAVTTPALPTTGRHTHLQKPTVSYVVRPQTLWNAMSIFRSTIVDNQEYFIQQKVYIRITQDHHDILRIGHILEIKSLDPRHVYVRVYWMYRPQDLPLTKQKYHGQSELIATNHMNVVDASRIVQHANVAHWAESSDPLPSRNLFWRQHYNVLTKELSQLQPTCLCGIPLNPDEQTVICTHCQLRMHIGCITRRAAERLNREIKVPNQEITSTTTPSEKRDYHIGLLPPAESNSSYKIVITDFRPLVPQKCQEDAHCLGCGEVLFGLF